MPYYVQQVLVCMSQLKGDARFLLPRTVHVCDTLKKYVLFSLGAVHMSHIPPAHMNLDTNLKYAWHIRNHKAWFFFYLETTVHLGDTHGKVHVIVCWLVIYIPQPGMCIKYLYKY